MKFKNIFLITISLSLMCLFLYHSWAYHVMQTHRRDGQSTVKSPSFGTVAPARQKVDNRTEELVLKLIEMEKPLLITFINDAYLPLTNSWLCNTLFMGIHEQILFFSTDDKTKVELRRIWPDINVISMGEESLSGNHTFQHVGYLKVMVKRTRWILWLIENKVEFLFFEVDAVWFSNPLPEIQNATKTSDLAVVPIYGNIGFCGCFIFMKPTDSTLTLWRELTKKMDILDNKMKKLKNNQMANFGDNDQSYLSSLIGKKFGGVKVVKLSFSHYPDGKLYDLGSSDRKKHDPVVLHNNWIRGNQAKINRAKKYKHWFWFEDTEKCDTYNAQHLAELKSNFTTANLKSKPMKRR